MTHRKALEALVKRLDEVHADPQYRGVWQMHMIHGGRCAGLTYTAELKAAHEALAEDRAVDDALDACLRELAEALAQLTVIREAAESVREWMKTQTFVEAIKLYRPSGFMNERRNRAFNDLSRLLEAIGPTESFTLRCETCRTEMRASAFKGECPVCGSGTVREIEGAVGI